MSRTDAHRPFWVWLNDHPEHVQEQHDHRNGVCDLPTGLYPAGEHTAHRPDACRTDLDPGIRLCGGPLCTGTVGRRYSHRSRRTAERALLTAARGDADPAVLERLEGRAVRAARLRW